MSLAVIVGSCVNSPRLTVDVVKQSDAPAFRIQQTGGNGLLNLTIWNAETRERLWAVALNYFPGGVITYGKVPVAFQTFRRQPSDAVQEFPMENKRPLLLPVKSRLFLSLACQYDSFGSASFKTFYFTLITDEQGSVSSISTVERIKQSEFPSTP